MSAGPNTQANIMNPATPYKPARLWRLYWVIWIGKVGAVFGSAMTCTIIFEIGGQYKFAAQPTVEGRSLQVLICYDKAMKTILITGGSDGLGKAIATRLAPNNKVFILSPHEEKLRKAAQEIGCEYKVCDVRDYGQLEKVVTEIGTIDCLVNSAGLWIQGTLEESKPDYIQDVMDVNAVGTINATKAVIPGMKQQGSGLIVNIISQAGWYAKAERSVYTASKWAITGFTKAIQAELAPLGICVTGLYPGMLKTDMFTKMGIEKDLSKGLNTEEVAKTIEFILSFDKPTLFTEVGLKNMEY